MKFEIYSCTSSHNNKTTHISRINISKLISTTPTKQQQRRSLERSLSRSSSINRMNLDRILTTNPKQQQQAATNGILSPTISKVKRNLFGRLNHDLLKNDLNEMWKETIEKQKIKWNFDFEALCPLNNAANAEPTAATSNKYEWTIVDESIPEFYKKSYKSKKALSSLNSSNASSNHSDEHNDSLNEPIFQMRLRAKSAGSSRKKMNKKKHQSLSKQRTLALTSGSNLIITYSENRKDTLRSSTKAKAKSSTGEFKQKTLLGKNRIIIIIITSNNLSLSLFRYVYTT